MRMISLASFLALACGCANGVEVPPSGLDASALSPTHVRLAWLDAAPGVSGYDVDRKDAPDGRWFSMLPAPAGARTYDDLSVEPGKRYWYRVRATGGTVYSGLANAETPSPEGLPRAPRELNAEAMTPDAIALSWIDESDDEGGFVILRAEAEGPYRVVNVTGEDTTSWIDGSVAPGKVYRYLARATNEVGDSALTLVAVAATPRE